MENGLADLLDSSSGITSWGRYYTKSVTLYNAEGKKRPSAWLPPQTKAR